MGTKSCFFLILKNHWILFVSSIYGSLHMFIMIFRKCHNFHAGHIMCLCFVYLPQLKGQSLKMLSDIKHVRGAKKVGGQTPFSESC